MNYVGFEDEDAVKERKRLERNERERNRAHCLVAAFNALKSKLPKPIAKGTKNKKNGLTKGETVVAAIDYIRKLQRQLEESSEDGDNGSEYQELMQVPPLSRSSAMFPTPPSSPEPEVAQPAPRALRRRRRQNARNVETEKLSQMQQWAQ